ncbi:GATA type transcriptional activator of nitrogen-regulated proteins [Coemansia sp. RSA 922]|nr:GATA type transcriptional activator of nitrogen-regulated proteins [Coemansia sp. S680]KAJ2027481.1 GATA type transcriptional activator of nitrogen-regulated proteins [Coemansia sp. S3946]KAJ2052257.1 GATA type transcriptional activator of nitrogen-regulated proteins [Coemansia sp. S2]KAJ2056204.1 GATA type transcriptional activator of nitrogen-regulated proteins [Coemansia sp. S155-1]KAJ2113389.1 GATA type transcriptional activator of nitrogen-regulated proteins [Coemansia sp. RSA 922]
MDNPVLISGVEEHRPNPMFSISALVVGPVPTANTAVKAEAAVEGTMTRCINCQTTSTPLWRRDPASGGHLCNRCGLYLKTYNTMHPLTKIKRRAINNPAVGRHVASGTEEMDDVEQIPRPANCHPPQLNTEVHRGNKKRVTPKQQISQGLTPRCFNCSAEHTPLWRRDPQDNIICNACGLYFKLHGKARPVAMKRAAIRRRNRTTSSSVSIGAQSVPAFSEPTHGGADPSMGGLEFLMRAAEMRHDPSKRLGVPRVENSACVMLESLATVAAAEIAASGDDGSIGSKEKLQMECQRLELLLAESKAVLSTLS